MISGSWSEEGDIRAETRLVMIAGPLRGITALIDMSCSLAQGRNSFLIVYISTEPPLSHPVVGWCEGTAAVFQNVLLSRYQALPYRRWFESYTGQISFLFALFAALTLIASLVCAFVSMFIAMQSRDGVRKLVPRSYFRPSFHTLCVSSQ